MRRKLLEEEDVVVGLCCIVEQWTYELLLDNVLQWKVGQLGVLRQLVYFIEVSL